MVRQRTRCYSYPRINTCTLTLGKYYIPRNISFTHNIYAIHHDSDIWGDSYAFSPSRFFGKTSILKDPWVPFASGPRQCPARNFALYEQRALAVREYEWTLPADYNEW